MEHNIYHPPIETPDGMVELEISHTVFHKDDEDMRVTISTTIQGKQRSYESERTEDVLLLLAKSLPEDWRIRSCFSCRFGNFCPVGNSDNELFCVTEFEPKDPRDLWHVTEDDGERENRSRTLFHCCEHYKEQTKDYFTYSDYYFEMNDRRNDKFNSLTKQLSAYEIKVSEDQSQGKLLQVEIINPFGSDNITVEYDPDDDDTPFTLYFAFQHRHMHDEKAIVEYINKIICGNLFSIEYFRKGKPRFGGEITAEELKNLSYEALERDTGYYGSTKLKECADSFKVRGWNSNSNFDAVFVTDESGAVDIKRLSLT